MEAKFQFYHTDPVVTAWHCLNSEYYYLWHCRLYSGRLLQEMMPDTNYDRQFYAHTIAKEMAYLRTRYQKDLEMVLDTHSFITKGTLPIIERDKYKQFTFEHWLRFRNAHGPNMAHQG
jgi:hypothetical protein